MNIGQLKLMNSRAIVVISNHITDSNDKYLLEKLLRIDQYLDARLSLNNELTYSDIITDKEFVGYVSSLWKPASLMGWYDTTLSEEEKVVVDQYEDIVKQIPTHVYLQE